jgi:acetyl-CoA carboxylase biotin carboxyl carrier protein
MARTRGIDKGNVVRWAESLAKLVRETRMSELRLQKGNVQLKLRRLEDGQDVAPAVVEAPKAAGTNSPEDYGTPVTSRFVGVFRLTHPKTSKAMIGPQDTVESNQVMGWIDCMGILHEVVAPRAGTVAEVLVEDSEPVEYGQVLLVIQ